MSRFLDAEAAPLTVMLQADNPNRIEYLIKKSSVSSAEAFGMQFCKLKREYKSIDTYKRLFALCGDKPVYVTNYRHAENEGKSDSELAREIITLAECGATLCDVMGDMFDAKEGEFTVNETAVRAQMELIDELHKRGAEVIMSSHIMKFTPRQRILEIALEHQRRGADISKIVVRSENMQEQIENIGIMSALTQTLEIPFLFLSGGECSIIRKLGTQLGSCMCLCVYEHDDFSTPEQPLLSDALKIREVL